MVAKIPTFASWVMDATRAPHGFIRPHQALEAIYRLKALRRDSEAASDSGNADAYAAYLNADIVV